MKVESDGGGIKEYLFTMPIIFSTCGAVGDLNGDGGYNVMDIVILANCVLGEQAGFTDCEDIPNGCAGDMNGNGGYNVLDIVELANCVLIQNCG